MRILVAGVGNVFCSDDGFGPAVATRLLAGGALPDGVEVIDTGIRGMHLAYQVLDGYDALVLVDVTRGDGEPGTLYLLEHDLHGPADATARFDPHGMEPDAVLDMITALARGVGTDALPRRALVLACEPAALGPGMGLTDAVAAVVDEAAATVRRVVDRLLTDTPFEEVSR
jgi:hydrogenase maturation protease